MGGLVIQKAGDGSSPLAFRMESKRSTLRALCRAGSLLTSLLFHAWFQ